jgi:hypothetical protein
MPMNLASSIALPPPRAMMQSGFSFFARAMTPRACSTVGLLFTPKALTSVTPAALQLSATFW